jgi:hypothetical protein
MKRALSGTTCLGILVALSLPLTGALAAEISKAPVRPVFTAEESARAREVLLENYSSTLMTHLGVKNISLQLAGFDSSDLDTASEFDSVGRFIHDFCALLASSAKSKTNTVPAVYSLKRAPRNLAGMTASPKVEVKSNRPFSAVIHLAWNSADNRYDYAPILRDFRSWLIATSGSATEPKFVEGRSLSDTLMELSRYTRGLLQSQNLSNFTISHTFLGPDLVNEEKFTQIVYATAYLVHYLAKTSQHREPAMLVISSVERSGPAVVVRGKSAERKVVRISLGLEALIENSKEIPAFEESLKANRSPHRPTPQ